MFVCLFFQRTSCCSCRGSCVGSLQYSVVFGIVAYVFLFCFVCLFFFFVTFAPLLVLVFLGLVPYALFPCFRVHKTIQVITEWYRYSSTIIVECRDFSNEQLKVIDYNMEVNIICLTVIMVCIRYTQK